MDKLSQPSPLDLTGDIAGNWRRFEQRLELYLQATGKELSGNKTKIAIMLTIGGPETIELYNTFAFAEGDYEPPGSTQLKFSAVKEKFQQYCDPKKNETYERYVFRSRYQQDLEPINQFITDVKMKAKSCNFGDLQEGVIRDQIIIGVKDGKMKERLLREDDLTLSKTEQLCRAAEAAQKQMSSLSASASQMSLAASSVDAVKPEYPKRSFSQCQKCGKNHPINRCPAFGKTCFKCDQRNHFSNCCQNPPKRYNRFASRNQQRKVNVVSQPESDEEFYINTIDCSQSVSEMLPTDDSKLEWLVNLTLNNTYTQFKVDSGAQVNCIPETVYRKLTPRPQLTAKTVKLRAYNKESIPTLGRCIVRTFIGNKWQNILFTVIKGDYQPILGLGTSLRFGFLNIPRDSEHTLKIQSLTTHNEGTTEDKTVSELGSELKSRFPTVFEGLGQFPDLYKIKLKPHYKPVIHPVRKVPLAYREKIDKELDRMEKLGVISKVNVPTEFVNSFVVTKKKGSDEIRLCLDPRDLNRSVMREHYYMKTRDQILAELGRPVYFTELDLRHAYWQIPLDEDSKLLTTFSTSRGRYCYNVAPFGLNSISEICQKRVEQHLTEGMEGVFAYQDNIIVVGDGIEQHDARLNEVFKKILKAGVTLNFTKCKFRQDSIMFIGERISKRGIEPDPDKVRAIQEWKTPHDVKSLQSFFGMLNFVGKFIPNIAARTPAMRTLLRKEAVWIWDENHDKELADMKTALITYPVLVFYDPSKQHKISNDASKDGIGSVLLQMELDGWHPVHYGARTLTKTERAYAPIEREALGILFGVTKFHQYVFGKQFDVETDHRPLVNIFEGYLNEAPARIQCIMLKVQKYDFKIQWVPRKYIMLADSLSKHVQSEVDQKLDITQDIDIHVNEVTQQVPVSDVMWRMFALETNKDPELSKLKCQIQQGKVPSKYGGIGAKLHVIADVIFNSHRIFVPRSLRSDMLDRAHEGHLGAEKSKRRARMCLYWPGMSSNLDELVAICSTCCKFRNKQMREPLIQDIQEHPWHKVGVDIFTLAGKDYLLVVDYMSNYPEISPLTNGKDIRTVIKALKPIFARHGIPAEVTSDNVPFTSHDFIKFSQYYGFNHSPISPRDSNANGKAEGGVKIVKRLLKKAYDSDNDPFLALLNYRAAPLECGKSPAQLLMGRNLRTRLPMLVNDIPDDQVQEEVRRLRKRQKQNYDKGTKELLPLKEGDTVRILQEKGPAVKAQVLDSPSSRSYRVMTEGSRILRRNRNFLIKTPESFQTEPDYETLDVNPGNKSLINQINPNLNITGSNSEVVTHNHQGNILNQCNNKHRNIISNQNNLMESNLSTNDNINDNISSTYKTNEYLSSNHENNYEGPRRSTRRRLNPLWSKDYQMKSIIYDKSELMQ